MNVDEIRLGAGSTKADFVIQLHIKEVMHMNRTAVHEAGHGLAAIKEKLESYRVVDVCEAGECRYRGQSANWKAHITVGLAGPAMERHFYGERRDELVLFSGTRDLAIVGEMSAAEFADWDGYMSRWAMRYASEVRALAAELA
jgi:hypothetical protein